MRVWRRGSVNRNYVGGLDRFHISELDRFLLEFDNKPEASSATRRAEEAQSARINRLMKEQRETG